MIMLMIMLVMTMIHGFMLCRSAQLMSHCERGEEERDEGTESRRKTAKRRKEGGSSLFDGVTARWRKGWVRADPSFFKG